MFDVDGLADYTQGRLSADDEETERILNRSVAAVRRWCGWHVAPVLTETKVLDGPGGPLLTLPTQKLVNITAVSEDGQALDLSALTWSRLGQVEKRVQTPLPVSYFGAGRYVHRTYLPWNFWTDQLSGVSVTMQHGYTADEAPDFTQVIYSLADRLSEIPAGGKVAAIGPFRWESSDGVSTQFSARRHSAFTATELSMLEMYRLEPSS